MLNLDYLIDKIRAQTAPGQFSAILLNFDRIVSKCALFFAQQRQIWCLDDGDALIGTPALHLYVAIKLYALALLEYLCAV